MNVEPCSVCGGTDLNLVDGFYYCVECGTQDMNVRETVVEDRVLADGTFTIRRHNKITIAADETQELSGEWHKWHAYNFMLSGLADEMILIGAKLTFKKKLLWLWTKYIKLFQNKRELGISIDGEETNKNYDSSDSSDDEINDSDISKTKKRPKYRKLKLTTDLSIFNRGIFIGLIYAALNLDHSEILISDLIRYIKEDRLDVMGCIKYLPKEIKTCLIPQYETFSRSSVPASSISIKALSIFKCLHIPPVLPDLKLIVDRYVKELCLPNDFKKLVLSLMNLFPCDTFLDLDRSILKSLLRLPPYEFTIMAYILVAFKMCFGLDDDYEVKISDAVEKINDENCYIKSYKFGEYSEPTDRLFSFREWCSFIHLRKLILCKYCLYMAEQYALDVDDYVYMEQCNGRKRQREKLLSDEITMNLLDKIPLINTAEVIPKSEFIPTLTPLTTYTNLVLQYFKDPDLKLLFSEDFTQYSLKYACEKLELNNEEGLRNIIVGVDESKKVINKEIYGLLETTVHDKNMVYVRNCDNKNWLKTHQPTVEHIKKVNKSNSDRESAHGYDSNSENISNNVEVDVSTKDEETSNHESEVNDKDNFVDERKLNFIAEEDGDKNIFDDDFENLVFVDESNIIDEDKIKKENEEWNNIDNHHENIDTIQDNDLDNEDSKSDISHNISAIFNPDTFDRSNTIKQLILATCEKYKIRIPNEYSTKEPTKRKSKLINDMAGESGAKRPKLADERPKRPVAKRGEAIEEVHRLLANYYNNVQHDVMLQISEHVKSVVNNANRTVELERTEDNDNLEVAEIDVNDSERNETDIQTTVQDGDNLINTNENVDVDSNLEQSSVQVLENDDEENSQAKGDPKFDENVYDIKQLYVKVSDNENSDDETILDDPVLNEILDKKIEEISKGEFTANKPDLQKGTTDIESDSEDDIPLSVLKEEVASMAKKSSPLQPLIRNVENIKEFKYWTRFYASDIMRKRYSCDELFHLELQENLPASFYFVIKECAGIVNCTPFLLYKTMVALEQRILCYNNT